MSTKPHLPIFNLRIESSEPTFHKFSSLPKELRLMIWRCALRRQRIIRVYLYDARLEDASTIKDRLKPDLYDLPHALQGAESYSITMCGSQILSKFFRVCSESRREAEKNYRVQIPCKYLQLPGLLADRVTALMVRGIIENTLATQISPGTLYFNPEWDFLHITCWPNAAVLLPPFLHDLKTRYDPHGHGLLNLVIPSKGSDNILDIEPSRIHPNFRDCFESTLQQLQEVFFEDMHTIGRINPGWAGIFDRSHETWFNRSIPMSTGLSTFDRFPIDPRPISGDLERLYISSATCCGKLQKFQRLLSRFTISPDRSAAQLKIMVAHRAYLEGSETLNICSRDEANEWLEKDYERWWVDRSWAKGSLKKVFEGQQYVLDSEPAFGFWLFPIEATTMMAERNDGMVFDMRCYAPELGLSIM